jgi:hypothetical protein
VDPTIHFGLGKNALIDSLEIWWPDGSYQILKKVAANQTIVLVQENAVPNGFQEKIKKTEKWFQEVTDSLGVDFIHVEDQFIDFKLQPILPHMHSRNGPGAAIADVNNDGMEDFYIGGAAGQPGRLYLQGSTGFTKREWTLDAGYEDMGALFFDANNDGFLDLYVVSGGVFEQNTDSVFQDRLYLNDGSGQLIKSNALPRITASGSAVVANDFDKDGDLDLFVGGRINPGNYPLPSKSYLLENLYNENPKEVKFRDIGNNYPWFKNLTMVSSALWTDYDNDGWTDLIVCGEFMPVMFFRNEKGRLTDATQKTGLNHTEGWWNSIAGGDFDNDGDTDYVLGNLGLNNRFKASVKQPLSIYAKDYDNNGRIDPIMTYFISDQNHIAHSRDEIIAQINAMRGRFKTYQSYADAIFETSFLPEELKDAYVLKGYTFESSYMENLGDGTFNLSPLPQIAQISPIQGIITNDIDRDGNLDVILTGNSYSSEISTGRNDALKGIILKGNGNGNFYPVTLEDSGFENDFDGSGLGLIRNAQGREMILSANSNGPLKIFKSKMSNNEQVIFPDKNSQYAEIIFKDGRRRKLEFYFGSGYLSQSSRGISIEDNFKEIRIVNFDGKIKTVFLDEAVE